MPREVISLRLSEELLARLQGCVSHHIQVGEVRDRTGLIEELIVAHLEHRPPFTRGGPNAFPSEAIDPGSVPEVPLYISR